MSYFRRSFAYLPNTSIRILIAIVAASSGIVSSSNYFNGNSNQLIDFVGYAFQSSLALVGLINYLLIFSLAILPILPGLYQARQFLVTYSWWGILLLSCGSTIFNVLLIGLIFYKINFFSLSSLTSAFISLIVFLLALMNSNWKESKELIIQLSVFTFGVAIGGLIWITSFDFNKAVESSIPNAVSPHIEASSNVYQIELAKHLKAKGFVLYALYSCPYSQKQKELFGKQAINQLLIIECTEDGMNNQSSLCRRKDIKGFPSWEFNGKLNRGTKSLKELAKISGYNFIR